ncbi:hypothetical protein JCM8547_003370 [Rhodosporidiobolus lusitaniae]
MSTTEKVCAVCREPNTNRCSKCPATFYCSRAHQVQDWQAHKVKCKAAAATKKPQAAPKQPLPVTYSTMDAFEAFPASISKELAHKKLIDAFRWWCDDSYAWNGEYHGIYTQEDPYPEFKRFVQKAQRSLPAWWSKEDNDAVYKLSRTYKWANIDYAVEKSDINEHHGSPPAAMALRMWFQMFTGMRY